MRWLSFCARTELGTSLAAFRIAMGLSVVLCLGSVVASDLVGELWVSSVYGGMRDLGEGGWLVSMLGGPTPGVMFALTWMGMAAGVLVAVGLGGRLMALIALQLVLATTDANALAGGSYDELLQNGLWLCVLAPSTTTLSADCRLRQGSWHSTTPVAVCWRYLIVFQLVLMYASTGTQKLSSYWTPGGDFSALYYILQQPSWHRFDMRWIAPLFPLTQLATAVSWFWEVLAPVWFVAFYASETAHRGGRWRNRLNRWRVREIFALLGIFFHVSVFMFMDVGPFTPISLGFYLALIHPWEYTALGRLRLGRSPVTETA